MHQKLLKDFLMHQKRKYLLGLAAFLAVMSFSKLAVAGTYTNDLTKCLVSATTIDDKSVLVRWMFATVALHPDVASMSSVTDAQRAEFNAKTARLFERLVTETCKTQTQAAVRNEGIGAIQSSFRNFGEVATRELVTNPKVASGLSNTAANLDLIKLMSVLQ
jgi:alpha-D-ribose 1-methylphosphonate 5-triphosphate synthase subunit PhnL